MKTILKMDPENIRIRELRQRPPEEWATIVKTLPEDIRPQVARVIWWDFFAGRETADRWPHLDCYLRPRSTSELKLQIMANWTREAIADAEYGRELSADEMAAALVQCGYHPDHAARRA